MLALPSASTGIAPPPVGGPMTTPGPVTESRDLMTKAAKLLFEAISKDPARAKGLNHVIELLTEEIRDLNQPHDVPGGATEDAAGPPALDRTPSGPPMGAGPGAPPGGNPAGALAALLQGGMR